MKTVKVVLIATTFLIAAGTAMAADQKKLVKRTDFPTQARVEYVLQCMAVNGKSPEYLQKCSCGIDVIASMLSYDVYETADTGLQMTNVPGVRAAAMRQTTTVIDAIDKLRKAQAESNLRCF